ncbi:MAG: hypothetical protein EA401_12050 [Planctomycetota bacterium]|nr:MAG: hypothetical protein EA401_12050 [Planctomycetota bacterium]
MLEDCWRDSPLTPTLTTTLESVSVSTPSSPSYWRFWWPLALVGLAMPLSKVFINGGLARLEDGVSELATVAYAEGLFHLAQATMAFLPQAATVLVRSSADHHRCRLLAMVLAVCVMIPIVAIGGPLRGLLTILYGIDGVILDQAARYLLLLAPLLMLHAVVGYTTGLLVRHGRTGWVSIATIAYLVSVAGVVTLADIWSWGPVTMVVGSQAFALSVKACIVTLVWRAIPHDLGNEHDAPISVAAIRAFFWPLAITSMMFAASRPVIYAVVGLSENALFTVAVLRVAFDLGLLAQMPINQFRHVLVTFVAQDHLGVARFMVITTAIIALFSLIIIISPLSRIILDNTLGIAPEISEAVRSTWLILVLVPIVVAWRNWHHGLAMVRQRTRSMALAAILRVLGTGGLCLAALPLGLLNHHWGALALVSGFLCEALIVRFFGRRASSPPALGKTQQH